MKFTVDRKAFSNAFSFTVKHGFKTAKTLPILNHVLIESRGEKEIRLSCSTLYRTASEVIEVVGTQERGSVIVDKKLLSRALYVLHSDQITIETLAIDEELFGIKLVCGSTEFELPAIDPAGKDSQLPFPPIPDRDHTIKVPGFQDALRKVVFAVSVDETRRVLKGVLVDGKRIVTTDGFRIATVDYSSDFRGIIDGSDVYHILNAFKGEIALWDNKNRLSVTDGKRTLEMEMVAGDFPNFDAVIPKTHKIMVECKTDQLRNAVQSVGYVYGKSHTPAIKLGFEAGKVTLLKETEGDGMVSDSLPADVAFVDEKAKNFNIAFCWSYLYDFLARVQSESVMIFFKSEKSPAKITPTGKVMDNWQYVLMPMALHEW